MPKPRPSVRRPVQARPDPARSVRDAEGECRVAPGHARRQSGSGGHGHAQLPIQQHCGADLGTHGCARRTRRRSGARERYCADAHHQSAVADLRRLLGARPLSERHPPFPGRQAAVRDRAHARQSRRSGGRPQHRSVLERGGRHRQGDVHRQRGRCHHRHDPVEGHVREPARLARPGQFVQVSLQLTTKNNAIVVPAKAVQDSQDGQYVYVVAADPRCRCARCKWRCSRAKRRSSRRG